MKKKKQTNDYDVMSKERLKQILSDTYPDILLSDINRMSKDDIKEMLR